MKHVILGKGMQSVANLPASIPACLLESLIGAIYIDGGYEPAGAFVRTHFESVARNAAASRHQKNFKSVLQQHAQTALAATPLYRVLDEQGPDHAKCFKVCVEIAGRRFEGCWGPTKKRAEQDAARAALRELGVDIDDPQPV
jgi:ribonuclease-3